MCGIACNRLGITPTQFYWEFTPAELHWALEDYTETHFTPMKRICESNRIVAQIVYNSAIGRKKKDMITDPTKIVRFGWEKPKIRTVDEMKAILLGLSHMKGLKVTQKGKPVEGI